MNRLLIALRITVASLLTAVVITGMIDVLISMFLHRTVHPQVCILGFMAVAVYSLIYWALGDAKNEQF